MVKHIFLLQSSRYFCITKHKCVVCNENLRRKVFVIGSEFGQRRRDNPFSTTRRWYIVFAVKGHSSVYIHFDVSSLFYYFVNFRLGVEKFISHIFYIFFWLECCKYFIVYIRDYSIMYTHEI